MCLRKVVMKIKKMDVNLAKTVEKTIFVWIWIRRYRITLFGIIILLLIIISRAPYINLFFSEYLILFFATILAPFILDIDEKPLFVLSLLLLILTFFLWVIDDDTGGLIINYLFIILFSGMLKLISSE